MPYSNLLICNSNEYKDFPSLLCNLVPRGVNPGSGSHVFHGAVHALWLSLEPRGDIGDSTRQFYLLRLRRARPRNLAGSGNNPVYFPPIRRRDLFVLSRRPHHSFHLPPPNLNRRQTCRLIAGATRSLSSGIAYPDHQSQGPALCLRSIAAVHRCTSSGPAATCRSCPD